MLCVYISRRGTRSGPNSDWSRPGHCVSCIRRFWWPIPGRRPPNATPSAESGQFGPRPGEPAIAGNVDGWFAEPAPDEQQQIICPLGEDGGVGLTSGVIVLAPPLVALSGEGDQPPAVRADQPQGLTPAAQHRDAR